MGCNKHVSVIFADTGSTSLAGLSIDGQITQGVPEPSAYLLSVIGLVGVMIVRWRRVRTAWA